MARAYRAHSITAGLLFTTLTASALAARVRVGSTEAVQATSARVISVNQSHRFAVSPERVSVLCQEDIWRSICGVLGASSEGPHPSAYAIQLAETLAEPLDDVVALLGTFGFAAQDAFSCQDFCQAAVTRIPAVLDVAAPSAQGVGCITADCAHHVGISAAELAKEGLSTPPEGSQRARDDVDTLPGNGTLPAELPLDLRVRRLFRLVVNVVIGLFPAMDANEHSDDTESVSNSLVESPDGIDVNYQEGLPGVDFELGPRTLPRRHHTYRQYAVKAAAWVAAAIRRLRSGEAYVQKWFGVSKDQVAAQTDEARRHLTRMLKLMHHAFIRKASPDDCQETATSGVMAFVMTSVSCNVQSARDCGEKTDSGRYIINICEWYWRPYWDGGTRVGTIVHESSHHFGTKDNGYCQMVDCLSMPSEKARNNADSYSNFVQDIVKAWNLKEEWQPIPHAACNTVCGAQSSTFENMMNDAEWAFNSALPSNKCGACTLRNRGPFGDACHDGELVMAAGWIQRVCCEAHACTMPSPKPGRHTWHIPSSMNFLRW